MRRIKFILKFATTAILLYYILRKFKWENILRADISFNQYVMIVFVLILMIIQIMISTVKWNMLLKINEVKIEYFKLLKYYFISTYFSNFLPSTIGGDGYRIMKTINKGSPKSGPISAVFIERITGILVLTIIGYISSFYIYIKTGDLQNKYISTIISIIVILSIVSYILVFRFKFKIDFIKGMLLRYNMLNEIINRLLKNPSIILWVIYLSFAFHFIFIINRLLLFNIFNSSIGLFELSFSIFASTLIAQIPISLNGIGLLDGSFIYFVTKYGMNYDVAVIVMVTTRLLQFSISVFGAILYVLDNRALQNSVLERS